MDGISVFFSFSQKTFARSLEPRHTNVHYVRLLFKISDIFVVLWSVNVRTYVYIRANAHSGRKESCVKKDRQNQAGEKGERRNITRRCVCVYVRMYTSLKK